MLRQLTSGIRNACESGSSKSAHTSRYKILDSRSRLPPRNAISEGKPPLCNTSSEAGALPPKYLNRDSDQKFSKSKSLYISKITSMTLSRYLLGLPPGRYLLLHDKGGSN